MKNRSHARARYHIQARTDEDEDEDEDDDDDDDGDDDDDDDDDDDGDIEACHFLVFPLLRFSSAKPDLPQTDLQRNPWINMRKICINMHKILQIYA